ncbi:MAG: thiamine diphosphokinase [Ignavibacteriaceae bacterium]|jgi:thiamine pyrophosphokinase
MKKCIILANGKSPHKSILEFLKKKNYSTLICADGGANSAGKLKIVPDFIIGDFDSINKQTLKKFKANSKIIQIKRQNDTDVEKCLKFAIKKKFSEAVMLGVTGNRLDHTFCNLGIVIKFYNKIKLIIVAENSILTPYTGKVELKTYPGETISLYGFDKKTKIYSRDLKYPLKNISLPFGEKESTSNIALTNLTKIKITGGIIFIIRDYHIVKKYDLL